MEKPRKHVYRYCIVPNCKNTSRSTPDKVFFPVPRNEKLRKQWCEVIRRDEVSPTTCLHCCEDHFNVDEDAENYVQYKIMKEEGVKVTLRLRQGVKPHKFQCQKRNLPSSVKKMDAAKRQKLAQIEEGPPQPVFIKCEVLETSESQEMNDFKAETSTSHIQVYKDKLHSNNEDSVVIKCEVLEESESQQTNNYEAGPITSHDKENLYTDNTDSVVIKCEVLEVPETEQTYNYEAGSITSHYKENLYTDNTDSIVIKCEAVETSEPQQINDYVAGPITSYSEVDSKDSVVIKCEVLKNSEPRQINDYEAGPITSHSEVDSKDSVVIKCEVLENSEQQTYYSEAGRNTSVIEVDNKDKLHSEIDLKCELLEISETQQIELYYEEGPGTSHIVSGNKDKKYKNTAVQVNIRNKYRSKGVNVNFDAKRRLRPLPLLSNSTATSSPDSDLQSCSSDDCAQDDTEKEKQFKNRMLSCMLTAIEKEPKMLIGLDKESYYLIKLLSENIPLPTINVLIILKKMKLNESFSTLALQFGYPEREICRIFTSNTPVIAASIKQFIVQPTPSQAHLKLPMSLRAKFENVVSIINCLEIEIEKPSYEIHQLLTWSDYKRCNTLKYFISSTVDGLVNFVSEGYSGKATDTMIVEHCGYLDNLPPSKAVMADNGFKDLPSLLEAKKCILLWPPSVPKSNTKDGAKQSRQIVAVRVQAESVINQLKEFHMLLPHACIERNIISVMNEVVIVACSIINMQNVLIKK